MDNLSLINTYGPYTLWGRPRVSRVHMRGAEQEHTAAEGTWLQNQLQVFCLHCVLLTPASLPGLMGRSSLTSEEKHSH